MILAPWYSGFVSRRGSGVREKNSVANLFLLSRVVLARILTELKLLDTTVGVVVLAAGVGNDVVGWILLALTVALVNASSGVVAVYVLLTGLAWTLFMLIPVRIGFKWLARRTGSLESGQPSTFIMLVMFLMVFTSAFFTDIIGEFEGFLFGGYRVVEADSVAFRGMQAFILSLVDSWLGWLSPTRAALPSLSLRRSKISSLSCSSLS